MSETLDQLQHQVGEWGAKTFPQSTVDTILDHLCEEVLEMVGPDRMFAALKKHLTAAEQPHAYPCVSEAPDALLLLLRYCDREGISLDRATWEKFRECQKRTWALDEAKGYARHVEATQ